MDMLFMKTFDARRRRYRQVCRTKHVQVVQMRKEAYKLAVSLHAGCKLTSGVQAYKWV